MSMGARGAPAGWGGASAPPGIQKRGVAAGGVRRPSPTSWRLRWRSQQTAAAWPGATHGVGRFRGGGCPFADPRVWAAVTLPPALTPRGPRFPAEGPPRGRDTCEWGTRRPGTPTALTGSRQAPTASAGGGTLSARGSRQLPSCVMGGKVGEAGWPAPWWLVPPSSTPPVPPYAPPDRCWPSVFAAAAPKEGPEGGGAAPPPPLRAQQR